MLTSLALLSLLALTQVADLETDDGRFIARTDRAPGFEKVREEHAVWQIEVAERTGPEGERLLFTQRLTTDQLGDRRLLAPDGSAVVTIRSEIFGTRPLVRIYRHGSDPDGLDEDDLELDRRAFDRTGAGRRWLVDHPEASWIGWRETPRGPEPALGLECVDGRVFSIDLRSGELLRESAERAVTVTPGVDPTYDSYRTAARITAFQVTPVAREGEPVLVHVTGRCSIPTKQFAGFDLEFRAGDQVAVIPRHELRQTLRLRPGLQYDATFEATAVIEGLEARTWSFVVEGADGPVGDPVPVDVLAPGLIARLSTVDASGRATESVSLFEQSVARITSARGEISYRHVPEERLEAAVRMLGRLPRNGYERASRRDRYPVTYELAWWPRGERRTVVVTGRTARGRIEELIELLRSLG